jgi:hypothetical protein
MEANAGKNDEVDGLGSARFWGTRAGWVSDVEDVGRASDEVWVKDDDVWVADDEARVADDDVWSADDEAWVADTETRGAVRGRRVGVGTRKGERRVRSKSSTVAAIRARGRRRTGGAVRGVESLSRRRLRISFQAASGCGMTTGESSYVIIFFTSVGYGSDVVRSA